MADLLQWKQVHELIEHRGAPCVSVFLPTHRKSPENEQDLIRLRNLLDEAEEQLVAGGLRPPEAREVLEPGRELLEHDRFWSYQSDGLSLFLASGWSRFFRLPLEFPELVVVADRFHIKPLLPLLGSDRRYYVLTLSKNEVRLLEGSRRGVEEVELADVPPHLLDALKYDLKKEHVAGRGGRGAPAVFHGWATGAEADKVLLERYLRAVDDGLHEVLREERAPLVLAGVEYERAMFRQLTRYPFVLEEGIAGDPDELPPEELHERALAIVEPVFSRAREDAAERYLEAGGHGEGAASDVGDVVRAALEGRVDVLFVPVEEQWWGTVDPHTFEVAVHSDRRPGDEDLLDRAAVQTLLTSGTVFAVPREEVSGPGPAAALLRY
jgi:Bacterial archaeo-eukaryotic release factor family 3